MTAPAPAVLVSVYGSDPARGSEAGVGFNWLRLYVEAGFRVIALVHRDRRGGLERTREALQPHIAAGRLTLVPIDITWLQRLLNRLPGAYYLFYYLYQRSLAGLARRLLHGERAVAHLHHVTMNGFREPGFLHRLGLPFVWGPIGGLQNTPPVFTTVQGCGARLGERGRTLLNRLSAGRAARPRDARARSALIFAANREARAWACHSPRARVVPLLETAVDETIPWGSAEARGRSGVLWVGNDEWRKNPEFALLAHHLLAAGGTPGGLTMVGLGPRRVDGLRRWAGRRRIDLRQVRFIAEMPRAELVASYASARVLWFTSYRDTSGNVMLEAMKSGLPVVAFDHQGAAVILDEGAGRLVAIGRYSAMLRAWVGASRPLLCDDDEWMAASRKALSRVEGRFQWKAKSSILLCELARAGLIGARGPALDAPAVVRA